MRKSILEGDPGYSPDQYRYEAFLDGKKLRYCFAVDEDLGKAWVYKTDAKGKLLRDGDDYEEECLRGDVKLIRTNYTERK